MKADYGWIIFLVIGILVAVFWGQITGGVKNYKESGIDHEAVARGAELFKDPHAWTPLENKACAMCHSADYQPGPEKITMADYTAGSPVELKNLAKKYKSDMLTNEDALYERAMICMTGPTRMGLRRANQKAQETKDLMAYLRSL
ncbi:MAG: c-type cytochrome [bacterium]